MLVSCNVENKRKVTAGAFKGAPQPMSWVPGPRTCRPHAQTTVPGRQSRSGPQRRQAPPAGRARRRSHAFFVQGKVKCSTIALRHAASSGACAGGRRQWPPLCRPACAAVRLVSPSYSRGCGSTATVSARWGGRGWGRMGNSSKLGALTQASPPGSGSPTWVGVWGVARLGCTGCVARVHV